MTKPFRPRHSGSYNRDGYLRHYIDGRRVAEHILVAERALGQRLPEGSVVHHINKVRDDNRPENLVICPNAAYHALIHIRSDALDACGNPDWRKCRYCKTHDDPALLVNKPAQPGIYWHRECANEVARAYRRKVAA